MKFERIPMPKLLPEGVPAGRFVQHVYTFAVNGTPLGTTEEGNPYFATGERGRPICGHRRGPDDVPCLRKPVCRDGKCLKHTTDESEFPDGKLGRMSRRLPERYLDAYEDALADPNLHSLREEMAITAAFMESDIADLSNDNNEAAWKELSRLSKLYKKNPKINVIWWVEQVLNLIETGVEEFRKRDRIDKYISLKSDLVSVETSRIYKASSMASAADMRYVSEGIYDIFVEEFQPELDAAPERAERIADRVNRLLTARDTGEAPKAVGDKVKTKGSRRGRPPGSKHLAERNNARV